MSKDSGQHQRASAEARRCHPHMMAYARSRVGHRDEANDLVQEALEKILRRIPRMKTDINLVAYGIRAVRNAHLDRWRSQRRLTELTDDEMAERCLETGSSSEMVEALQAYGKLEERCQILLGLVAEGQRYVDISRILEMTEGAVAGAISRCRSYLVKLIRGRSDGPLRF